MKILVVCDNLLPPFTESSGTKGILYLFESLASEGHQIHILTIKNKWTTSDWKIWSHSKPFSFFVVTKKIFYLWKAFNLNKKFQYDVIHEFSSSPLIANRSGILKWLTRKKVFHSLCTFNLPFLRSLKWCWIPPNDIFLDAPIPIEEEFFEVEPIETNPLLSKNFLYLGLLNKNKGIEVFLNSLPAVFKKVPGAQAIIVTPPFRKESNRTNPYLEKIQLLLNQYPDQLKFIQDILEIPKLLEHIPILVYPLETTFGTLNQPKVLMEAMASGRAIIHSDLKELNKLTQKRALTFKNKSSSELSYQLIKLLEAPKLTLELGKKIRELAKPYQIQSVLKWYLDAYNKKERIAFLSDISPHSGSWIGRYQPWIKYLEREGFQTEPFLPNQIYANKKYSTFQLIRFCIQNAFVTFFSIFNFSPDILFIGKPLPVSILIGLIYKFIFRKKIWLDCDDLESEINTFQSTFQKYIVIFFERLGPKIADQITTNTFENKMYMGDNGIPINKIYYVPNGVDPDIFKNTLPEDVHSPLKTILYFGDLNLQSGHALDLLINAFSLVSKKIPNCHLKIIGSGSDESRLKSQAEILGLHERIEWIPSMPQQSLLKHIKQCDLIVDPVRNSLSNQFRCPLKIIEALYLGKKIVTGDVGDRKDLLNHPHFLVETEKPIDWANAMINALENKETILPNYSFSWKNILHKLGAVPC